MRISDWSSDVCSSDLLCRLRSPLPRWDSIPGEPAEQPNQRSIADLNTPSLARPPQAFRSLSSFAPRSRIQIGRASCRERVCQYVYISVVSVTLKKKQ